MAGGPPLRLADANGSLLWVAHPSRILGRVNNLILGGRTGIPPIHPVLVAGCACDALLIARSVQPRTLCPMRKDCGTLRCKCNRKSKINPRVECLGSALHVCLAPDAEVRKWNLQQRVLRPPRVCRIRNEKTRRAMQGQSQLPHPSQKLGRMRHPQNQNLHAGTRMGAPPA